MSIFPTYFKLWRAVTRFYWYSHPGCLAPGIGSGRHVSLRTVKWRGRVQGGRKIQKLLTGLYPHCSEPRCHPRMVCAVLFPSYSLPLLKILFVLQFVQDCEFYNCEAEPCPSPWKAPETTRWVNPHHYTVNVRDQGNNEQKAWNTAWLRVQRSRGD